jgi:hypothetical protein
MPTIVQAPPQRAPLWSGADAPPAITTLEPAVDTPDLTAVAEKLGRGTEQLTADAQERARELRQRVGSSLEDLHAGEHVREVGDQLRHQLDDTIKPAVHQAAPSLGKGILTAIQALAALPVLLIRFAGRLVSTAESVPERGAELKERAQHLLHDNPRARRQRRQRRVQLAMWTGAGFGVGVGVGWFLGRRSTEEMAYDPLLPVPAVAPPPFASSTPGSAQALPEDPFEAAAAAEEVLEDQLAAAADAEELIEAQLEEAARAESAGDAGSPGDRPSDEASGGSDDAADHADEGEASDRPDPEA